MNSTEIFEALGEVDEKLIERAGKASGVKNRRAVILKKTLVAAACMALVVSLAVGGVIIGQNNPDDDYIGLETPDGTNADENEFGCTASPSKIFLSLDEFKAYINDKENQEKYYRIDEGVYIDFDSIVSNSEIYYIGISQDNSYSTYYIVENDFCNSFQIYISKKIRNISANIECDSIDELREIEQQLSYSGQTVQLKAEDHNLFYRGYYTQGFTSLWLLVGDYCILFEWDTSCSIGDYLPSQAAFLSAIVPAHGATDESVIAMCNRIKALIPTSNKADSTQETDSADKNDTASADDGVTNSQTVGETVSDTDVGINEEEEYLYPEDYEFPVIPGISPDWKPNRNGKYPYKDGYTKYELTLILACEILIDFGDLTDEEISKLEFRCIEED